MAKHLTDDLREAIESTIQVLAFLTDHFAMEESVQLSPAAREGLHLILARTEADLRSAYQN